MDRAKIAAALRGHRLDTMSQDSGNHCTCGSDSRFEQRDGDHPWTSIDEHRADVVMRVLRSGQPGSSAGKDTGLRAAIRAAIFENIAAPHERYDAATDAVLAALIRVTSPGEGHS